MQVIEADSRVPTRRITEGRDLPAMDSHFGLAPSALRHANVQEATTKFQKALTANGYLRARAIRMKLLHLHIAAITGVHQLTHRCVL